MQKKLQLNVWQDLCSIISSKLRTSNSTAARRAGIAPTQKIKFWVEFHNFARK